MESPSQCTSITLYRGGSQKPSQSYPNTHKKRKYERSKPRQVTWTKAHKWLGQATLDLNNNMNLVPVARPKAAKQENKAMTSGIAKNTDPMVTLAPISFLENAGEWLNDPPDSGELDARMLTKGNTNSDLMGDYMIVWTGYWAALPTLFFGEHNPAFKIPPRNFEECEQRLEAVLKHAQLLEEELRPYFRWGFEPAEKFASRHLRIMGQSLRATQSLGFDCYDSRQTRLSSLRLGIYATAVRLLEKSVRGYCPDDRALMDHFGMPASMWKDCVHDFMESLRQRRPETICLDDVKAYLLEAKDVVRSLQVDAPHLYKYWNSYLMGLDHYIDCLEQIREGRTDWSHPDIYLGDFVQQPPKPPDLSYGGPPKTVLDFTPLHGDSANDDGDVQQYIGYFESMLEAFSDRPTIVGMALKGWRVFGQGISDTFDYYLRMYKILCLTSLPQTGRQFTQWLNPSWLNI